MVKRVQIIGKTSAELASYTPRDRELTVNETDKTLVIGDGTTVGGIELALKALTNVSAATVVAKLVGQTISAITITALTATTSAITTLTTGSLTVTGSFDLESGGRYRQIDQGTLTGNLALLEGHAPAQKLGLDAARTITFGAATSGDGYTKLIKVVQTSSGNYTPTFEKAAGGAGVWTNTEPTWSARAAGKYNYVVAHVTADAELLLSHYYGN